MLDGRRHGTDRHPGNRRVVGLRLRRSPRSGACAGALCSASTRRAGLVLGDGSTRDVIAHGASLQQAFEALQDRLGETVRRLDDRLGEVERRLTGRCAPRPRPLRRLQRVLRSAVDVDRPARWAPLWIVLTCIHHRDQARVYAKQILDGNGELELSPEEAEAVPRRAGSRRQPGLPTGLGRLCRREPGLRGARPRAGYLGPEGTFSEEALFACVPAAAVTPLRTRRSATP